MANSSTSLYSYTPSTSVSSNNFTTLYNTTTGNVVTANVPDRNFTTLYTNQSDIQPTSAYGNSNVEAFLNTGTDGANQVQNIVMYGNLHVGGQSFLGNISDVHINGGQIHYVISTDGNGNLVWEEQANNAGNTIPYIHFNVTATANNQQFTDANLELYQFNYEMNVMKNGVNIEPSLYEKINATTIQINILLNDGDTIDVLAQSTGSNVTPGGNVYEVQYNNGSGGFDGNSNFVFDQANSTLNITNIASDLVTSNNVTVGNLIGSNANIADLTASNIFVDNVVSNTMNATNVAITNLTVNNSANLGNVANVHIGGGSANYILKTDGLGNLSWTQQSTNATSLFANINNVHISGGSLGQVLKTYGNSTLYWDTGGGGGGGGSAIGGASAIQFANPITPSDFSGTQDFTYKKEFEDLANTSHLHINSDTDPNVGTPDFSVISFDKDGQIGNGYGRYKGYYLDFKAEVERHICNAGFELYSASPLTTPTNYYIAGDIKFNESYASTFAPANVSLGNIANLKIIGGTNGQVLKTDGANNLSFTSVVPYANIANSVAGANVSGQVNFAAVANSVAGANVSGQVSNALIAGTVYTNAQPNITSTGTLTTLNVSGNITASRLISNIATGTAPFTVTSTTQVANLNVATAGTATSATTAGTVTTAAQPNITSTGTLTSVTVSGNLTAQGNVVLQRAFEIFTPNGTASTGTVDFDVITQSILVKTANAAANCTLNIRGNSTVSLNTLLPVNDSLTIAFVNPVGTTAYVVNAFTIDGASVTPKYVNGSPPTTGTRLTSATQTYTYTILKTASSTYTVLGSLTEYK